MFIEPLQQRDDQSFRKGWIEVICGSMFSGKTEELIRRLKRAEIAKLKVGVFKPAFDKRYHAEDIVSHSEISISAVPLQSAASLLVAASDYDVIGVDECQFFDEEITTVLNTLAGRGKRIIVSGLDTDYQAKPFGAMPAIMAIAEYVTKLQAICMVCGSAASRTFRKSLDKELALLGEADLYEARCRRCYELGESEKKAVAE
jgi:thymidine kinase